MSIRTPKKQRKSGRTGQMEGTPVKKRPAPSRKPTKMDQISEPLRKKAQVYNETKEKHAAVKEVIQWYLLYHRRLIE
ncbi:hypothetical protein T265_02570 [Opisthorchis viverrini]|uniref:Uncharacterized protein n=1 Tax=Opisthorchis viverrini TaxID=6198 RepID=A0A074ZUI4_OPIVI|nr:hypothetical protein T265_02570 [Opisthorchis viverrini]KER31118.1 hypothetical protein T265_02570 [Opisthorchis viverrini]